MAKTRTASEDVLQRQLVFRKLARMLKSVELPSVYGKDYTNGYRDACGELQAWLKGAARRASRVGGIGRT